MYKEEKKIVQAMVAAAKAEREVVSVLYML